MSAQSLRVPQTGFHKGPLPAQAKHIAWPHLPRPYRMTMPVAVDNVHNQSLRVARAFRYYCLVWRNGCFKEAVEQCTKQEYPYAQG